MIFSPELRTVSPTQRLEVRRRAHAGSISDETLVYRVEFHVVEGTIGADVEG